MGNKSDRDSQGQVPPLDWLRIYAGSLSTMRNPAWLLFLVFFLFFLSSKEWDFAGSPVVRTQFSLLGPGILSPVGELRSPKPCSVAKHKEDI